MVCLSVCLSVGRNFEPFESNRIDSRCCLGCRLWWAQVTDGGLDLLMGRDNFGGCPSLKCIRLHKQQTLQQPGVQCRLVHVGQSVTAIAQSARLTLQPCSTFFVSREVSGVVGQSGNTGCLTLLEVLEIYWNYFYPPPEILEIYKVSCKLPGSVWLFVVNVPDSFCMSEVFNVLCSKSAVENILQYIRISMILGLATTVCRIITCSFIDVNYLPKLCRF